MASVSRTGDTIAAIATAAGEASVGIVRLSGPEAISIVDGIFFSKGRRSLGDLKGFSMRHGWITREKARGADGASVDEVIVSLMRAPKSYTREDVVEIGCHGGIHAVRRVLELVLSRGARLADPGEFTRRAFLNGRLDLLQAEAVLDVIRANGDLSLSSSLERVSGQASGIARGLRRSFLDLLSDMEVRIDMADEAEGRVPSIPDREALEKLQGEVRNLIEQGAAGRIVQEGLKVVLCGRPNTGKSSLLNALLRQERAIVTALPGTTRDTIEEVVHVRGLALRLTDTAGVLEARDAIEEEAQQRTRRAIEAADFVLLLIDGSVPLSDADVVLIRTLRARRTLVVVNKSDLPGQVDAEDLAARAGAPVLKVSALTGQGIPELEEAVFARGLDGGSRPERGAWFVNQRHADILRRVLSHLEHALEAEAKGMSLEFFASDVRRGADALGELTGEIVTEEILDNIFSKFCVGK